MKIENARLFEQVMKLQKENARLEAEVNKFDYVINLCYIYGKREVHLYLQTSDFRLRTSDFGLQTSETLDLALQTSHFRLQTLDFRIGTSDFRCYISPFLLRTSHFRLECYCDISAIISH